MQVKLVVATLTVAAGLVVVACSGGATPQGPYMYVRDIEMGWDHVQPPSRSDLQARVCAVFDTGEPAAGVEVTATARGPGVLAERFSAFAEGDGCAFITWPINSTGPYTIKVERLWMSRVEYFSSANVVSSASVEVTNLNRAIAGDQP